MINKTPMRHFLEDPLAPCGKKRKQFTATDQLKVAESYIQDTKAFLRKENPILYNEFVSDQLRAAKALASFLKRDQELHDKFVDTFQDQAYTKRGHGANKFIRKYGFTPEIDKNYYVCAFGQVEEIIESGKIPSA